MPRQELKKNQTGQTLIETMVGIFVLVMGITAALGLATFSLGSSTNIVKQLIGMGLAREGIEVVKNMRDTNWLQDTLVADGCYDFRTDTESNAPCYVNWLNTQSVAGGYNIDPGDNPSGTVYEPQLFPSDNQTQEPNYYWHLDQTDGGFGLQYNHKGTLTNNDSGLFYPIGSPGTIGSPDHFGTYYYRKIVLTKENTAQPYNKANMERLKVQSQVWWTDKKCPPVDDFPGVGSCAIELTMYLTNWKNYQ